MSSLMFLALAYFLAWLFGFVESCTYEMVKGELVKHCYDEQNRNGYSQHRFPVAVSF